MNNLLLKLIPFTGTQKKFYINDILSNTYRLFHRFDEIVKSFIKKYVPLDYSESWCTFITELVTGRSTLL